MGVFDIFRNKGGMDCSENEDGTLTCRKFSVSNNSKLSTGSEATIGIDPKTCKAFFSGRYSVLEQDEEDFQRIAKKRESACRGGIN